MKNLLRYPSLLLLIGFNLYLIWYYQAHPQGFKTLLLLYWFQSIMLGFFTFILMMSVTFFQGKREPTMKRDGCLPWFFAFHYGTFHLVYLIFLVMRKDGPVDFGLLKITAAIILLSELMDFIRKWNPVHSQPTDTGVLMVLPYLRVVPMHLVILGAAFWAMSHVTIFLVVKTIADIVMYVVTNRIYFRQSLQTT